MKPLIYSERALGDLERVLHYIAKDNPTAAVAFVDKIEEVCDSLAESPQIGERQDNLTPGLRRFTYRRYVIYYRELSEQVRIERVLHGAMSVDVDRFE